MSLPKPNCSFAIPSIHDDIELECRIYYPRRTERNHPVFGKGFAVVAHPYAPLGGCYDDPVVAAVGGVLLLQGYVLMTFNFRGASGSAGRTSWSGKPELSDYVSVYGFLLCYIHAIFRSHAAREDADLVKGSPILVLGGYSYGSMIASHLPARDVVVDLFNAPVPGTVESEIRLRAENVARDARAYLDMHSAEMTLADPGATTKPSSRGVVMGGYESDAASRRVSRDASRHSLDGERMRQNLEKVRRKLSSRTVSNPPEAASKSRGVVANSLVVLPRVAYVLVSPILSTAAGFTTMFSKLRFTRRNGESPGSEGKEFQELTLHPCCCLYGSRDNFTSARKIQRWTEELQSRSASQFVAISSDTGHFWQDVDGAVRLRQGLAEFLRAIDPKDHAEDKDEPDDPSVQAEGS